MSARLKCSRTRLEFKALPEDEVKKIRTECSRTRLEFKGGNTFAW